MPPITRTALEDYELSGAKIEKGQRVAMFYRSANFDEDVFDDPFRFNILRDPNPHVGFGGTGAHDGIGANLARMTIDLMFNAVAHQCGPIRAPVCCSTGWLRTSSSNPMPFASPFTRKVWPRASEIWRSGDIT